MGVIKFGTDGWRGVIAKEFTFDRVACVAAAVGKVALDQDPKAKAMIGYDRRFLSREFAQETACVLAAMGVKVLFSENFCTTPCTSFVAHREGTPLSPMMTASHNPPIYNGFKIKGPHGGPATPEQVAPVQELASKYEAEGLVPDKMNWEEGISSGAIQLIDAKADYLAAVKKHLNVDLLKKCGKKVVVDAMHGAGTGFMKQLLDEIGVEAIEIRSDENPSFGGVNPEPITKNLGASIDKVRETGADLGLAMDGDADRLGVVDETGRFVTTQEVFSLVVKHAIENLGIKTGEIVKTISSSVMLDKLAEIHGVGVHTTRVGFKDVCDYMIDHDWLAGGEESGGYTIKGHILDRDGLLCGLLLLEMMALKGMKMSELVDDLMAQVGYHTFQRNDVHTTNEKKERALSRVADTPPDTVAGLKVAKVNTMDGYHAMLEDGSWLLVRASGTEPLLRIYCEAVADDTRDKVLADMEKFLLSD
ncbi:MAG: phosphoglucomutase/phosphomannomutase family protein [Candidatus Omnitrophica bacterium]|nr:phosphoglucomutase/phosphomannomutase family protein [Candidatus Omnitrophota bacterium]